MRFYDPSGERFGLPTYPWQLAPDGLLTFRQLRARGLRPGGQEVVAQILWCSNRYRRPGASPVRAAYLYRLDLAKPVRPLTPAKRAALAKANAAQRLCPNCRLDAGYRIPASLGMCTTCAELPANVVPAAVIPPAQQPAAAPRFLPFSRLEKLHVRHPDHGGAQGPADIPDFQHG